MKSKKRGQYVVKCQISYRFYCHCMSETRHLITLWTREHLPTLEISEMFYSLVNWSVLLKI